MEFLDLTLSTPAENLACDEALLDWHEADGGDGILRFWESPETFVVVGYANKIEAEVDAAACETARIPILRRCSGGGTVLQGRGCLNYALVLEIAGTPALASISGANQYIMERTCAAVQEVVGEAHIIKIQGHTDLACAIMGEPSPRQESAQDLNSDDSPSPLPSPAGRGRIIRQCNSETTTPMFRKFSGNSQRRHKNFLLFHGTFLLDFDLALVGKYLKFPSRQPEYRDSRSHKDFLMALNVSSEALKTALKKFWQAEQPLQNPPMERISKLTSEKYVMREWNLKF